MTDELLKALKQVHKNSVRAQTYHKALADLEFNNQKATEAVYQYLTGGKKIE